jgi:hypothetical protein
MPPRKPVQHRKQAIKWVGAVQEMGRALLGKKTARALGSGLTGLASPSVPSFKLGGKVKKTGLARVHAGELVVPAKQAAALKRLLK